MSRWVRILYTVLILTPFSLVAANSVAATDNTRKISHLFDIEQAGATRLVLPTDVEVSGSRVYIVDSGNHRIIVLDTDGKPLLTFGRQGSGKGEMQRPVGLGIGSKGQIFVADSGNNRIQIFSAQGQSVGLIDLRSGDKPVRPIDVAVDPETGNLYVTGNNNHMLMVYGQDGKKIMEWGGNGASKGMFRYPATVAVAKESRIAVVDVLNTRVQLFQSDGRFLVSIGNWGVLPGQLFRPKGIAIDETGLFYVSDSYMNLIQVFSDSGEFLYVLKHRGTRAEMVTPAGIAVSHSHLYVAEMLRHRVSVFQLD